MLPGFSSSSYCCQILGWAIINPKIAPKLREGSAAPKCRNGSQRLERGGPRRCRRYHCRRVPTGPTAGRRRRTVSPVGYGLIWKNVLTAMVPLAPTVAHIRHGLVVRHHLPTRLRQRLPQPCPRCRPPQRRRPSRPSWRHLRTVKITGGVTGGVGSTEDDRRVDGAVPARRCAARADGLLTEPTSASAAGKIPSTSMPGSGRSPRSRRSCSPSTTGAWTATSLRSSKELVVSVVPLWVLTVVVLAVILFGITTATESAAIGALGALDLAVMMNPGPCPVVEPCWGDRRRGARLASRRFRDVARVEEVSAACSWEPWCLCCGPCRSRPSYGKTSRIGIPDGEDHSDGVLALCRLGAVFRRLRVARRPGTYRTLGVRHEPVAVGFLIISQLIIFLLGWPLEVDRDHRYLLSGFSFRC